MGTNGGTIKEQIFQIGIIGKVFVHLLPDSLITPAGEALIDAVPFAISLGEQAPLCATAQHPQHTA
jgi:hypothetical protein